MAANRRDFMKGRWWPRWRRASPPGVAADPPVFQGITRQGRDPGESPTSPPPPCSSVERVDGLLIERDVGVKLRDGVTIYVDIYRADGAGRREGRAGHRRLGTLRQAHRRSHLCSRESGVNPEWISKHAGFEALDPAYWCPRGYAVVYPNPRGTWQSEGDMHHGGHHREPRLLRPDRMGRHAPVVQRQGRHERRVLSRRDPVPGGAAQAAAPGRHQSVGRSSTTGTASSPITAASARPASCRIATGSINWSLNRTEDTLANVLAHPLYDEYWESKENLLEDIEVPAFVVASWSDQGFHTRGTLDCFRQHPLAAEVAAGARPEEVGPLLRSATTCASCRRSSITSCKGTDDTVLAWPKVRIEVRERRLCAGPRAEAEWPLQRQRLLPLYLDAAPGTLAERSRAARGASVSYESTRQGASGALSTTSSRRTPRSPAT